MHIRASSALIVISSVLGLVGLTRPNIIDAICIVSLSATTILSNIILRKLSDVI